MHVLSLLWGFSLGGISKYALGLQDINKIEGIDLTVETACIYGESWGCDITDLFRIDAHLIPIRNRADFSWVQRTNELIDKLNPDLILVHGFNGPVVVEICNLRAGRWRDYVATYHGLYSAPKPSRKLMVPLFNYIQEWLYRRRTKAILSVCEHSRIYLLEKGVPPEKVTAIHNGIAPDAISGNSSELRSELGFSETDFVVGVASRLDPVKGVKYLIDAFPSVISAVPSAKLVIFGTGVCESQLASQCNQLKVSHAIHFAGYRENIPEFMNALDLFALPSLAEFHSIGLLEAMRAKLPIVATDVGGNPESIVDGISGRIVPPKDPEALASAIIDCALDRDLRESLAKNARLRFEEEFTFDKHLHRTADWLLRCVD
ncbi:glycosyltransferase family 4 protein [Pseudohalioglobus sediminis]|uniref:Glycosyltransferase family 4 protein n=1 Tax=Pseudohalioglobus sediminis TaxID=2606449 RepID=A0A5B0WR61_9GAMM|nr:glycosyltransferase family 4 protein [Pseudohalioglobus sediminis]KAA1188938.1 glycosyltransferase family 4 protein [Pseudohalioglobus sediminis]